ncbi:MAG: 1-phosphofructokinase family hexose kinase [Candidatus Hydrogenedentales bacterium]|jgi:tagatose 6-phosphate kinase
MILTVTPNPCIDKTLFVEELRIGEKIRAPRYSCITGGKGCNVSRALKVMGGDTKAMLLVGGATGQHALQMLEEQDQVKTLPVWVAEQTRTITTVLEEGVHRQTAFFEPGPRVTEAERLRFLTAFETHAAQAALITFNGSAPDPALDLLYRDLLECAHALKVPVILDAYGAIFTHALEQVPFMIKPNLEELELFVGQRLDTRAKQWRAIDTLRQRGISWVVLSLGAEGALIAGEDGCFHAVPPAIQEINAVGSGDALVAGFALGLTQNCSTEDTARLGIAMGTANAASWDICSFTKEAVEHLIPQIRLIPRDSCVYPEN